MGWLIKEVTETVTHRRQTSRCDGCGKEEYQGRPVIGDPPLGWHIPEGWTSLSGGEKDAKGFTVSRLACSRACTNIITAQAFGATGEGGQVGGIKRLLGRGQGSQRP